MLEYAGKLLSLRETTITREMISSVARRAFKTDKQRGDFLTLLMVTPDRDFFNNLYKVVQSHSLRL